MTTDTLKKIIGLLEGLEDKRLAHGCMKAADGCLCTQAAICPRELWDFKDWTMHNLTDLDENFVYDFQSENIRKWAEGEGLSAEDLNYLANVNDDVHHLTPEQRYVYVLGQLKKDLEEGLWDDT